MNTFNRLESWGNLHHPPWLGVVRVLLGVFLCFKAILFLMDMSNLAGLIGEKAAGISNITLVMLGQFIVIMHLMGGLLIAIGLHTRLASLVQIPILVAAVFLLSTGGENILLSEILIAIITLLLLIVFAIVGNGPWSYSRWFREEKKNDYMAEK